jgi:hypothetical protein
MQLWNKQQQTIECVEVYYERLLKLTNCLHVKTTYVFLTIIFRIGLLLYLILKIASMNEDTSIEHKETAIICEESGLITLSYNVLLTTPKANTVTKLIVLVVIVKSHQLVPIMVKQVTHLRLAIIRKYRYHLH